MEVHIVIAALARTTKSRWEQNCWSTEFMKKRIFQSFKQILSSKLLKTKNHQNDENNHRHWLLLPPLFKQSGGKTVKVTYIKKVLAMSQPISTWKGLACCPRTGFLAGMMCQRTWKIHHISPQLTFFFLFLRAKMEMASLSLSQESFKASSDVVVKTTAIDEFADALWQYMNRCEMYFRTGCD
jgi:hypothetical protein